jgi:hypothetical protein
MMLFVVMLLHLLLLVSFLCFLLVVNMFLRVVLNNLLDGCDLFAIIVQEFLEDGDLLLDFASVTAVSGLDLFAITTQEFFKDGDLLLDSLSVVHGGLLEN